MAGLVPKRSERKIIRQEQAIERNNAYQKMVSTKAGINEYISLTKNIGKKQLAQLKSRL
tara:strand:- start:1202 stop:1378 length:177 start_codon:yes stop_codon:yes gene_type:complete